MDCNKDEAIRAKVIAERKLTEKDFAGAKKFVLKAQTLCPGLEGLSQMLTTLDVYISAENKVSGEVDWYGVLGVSPSADEETVRKQYRKLALMLHPDKNKSVGADGAFKLLSEAWSLLSDKAKRLAYNQRRISKGFQQKVVNKSGGPSAPPKANGFHSFPNSATSNAKTQNNTAQVRPPSVPPAYPRTDTFWTICHRCKMHYEYLRVYLNNTLLCPNCHQAFLASETDPPVNFPKPSNSSPQQKYQNPGPHITNVNASYQGRYVGANKNIGSTSTENVQLANEKLKRQQEEAHSGGGWESVLKKRRGLEDEGNGSGCNTASQMAMANGGASMGSSSLGVRKGGIGFYGVNSKPNSIRELTHLEIRNMMMAKARIEICRKLNQWRLETVTKAADAKKRKMKEKSSVKADKRELNGNGVSSATIGGGQANKFFTGTSADGKEKETIKPMSINVPDPDFHDFDQDRTERSFGDNQVWAAYDNDDGMPRFYAMIHNVKSLNPFKMRISWLNSKTNTEFGPIDWVGSGFLKTCGDFRVGKHEINESLNSFSHRVKWAKGPRGTVRIFPKKGDIWALYRNWSPAWNEHTPDDVVHKYDMVEVLEDYNEDQGVSVAPLIKVFGFRTVFQADTEIVRRIPKEEMFRFSHQVPNYLLTGLEAQNAPKGCQELDPAATPFELLQVVTNANNATMEKHDGRAGKEILQTPEIRAGEIATNTTGTKDKQLVENGEEEMIGTLKEPRKQQ
ncbi:hypothetical protein U1Q18_004732 [Sarracenia purpurea var. burkii]